MDVADPAPASRPEPCVSLDLEITTLATLSTGETFPDPKAQRSSLGRLRCANWDLLRERKGLANRARA